ncbi:hypothetical protein S40285_10183 [Stachybotrys chlorohalonatus IBT 40285]|uniref:Uncharacterized protein n=1 Tax=Stachybotrys chlorohalonatus (strain IBT 40285) TaxID=1283841 RepID=A0A084QJD0_STAC4|nr:hypothetical protein S40285_10183 [Stachybotrys chlorohalonata IBT 40285]
MHCSTSTASVHTQTHALSYAIVLYRFLDCGKLSLTIESSSLVDPSKLFFFSLDRSSSRLNPGRPTMHPIEAIFFFVLWLIVASIFACHRRRRQRQQAELAQAGQLPQSRTTFRLGFRPFQGFSIYSSIPSTGTHLPLETRGPPPAYSEPIPVQPQRGQAQESNGSVASGQAGVTSVDADQSMV